jgi:F-type H+-transporting ATPase subunit b
MHEHGSIFADPRFWVGAAFFVFFLIFGGKAWNAITKQLDNRAAGIRAELDEASRLRREAEAMLADASTRREAAMREAEAMLAQARTEAQRVAEAARTDAVAAATRREKLAMDRIASAEKAAITDVRLAAADIAARAAEQVIRTSLSEDADAHLIDRAIQGLPAALAGRYAA